MDAPLEIVTEAGEGVRVVSLVGVESVSRPFRFEVEVATASAPAALLGARATLLVRHDGEVARRVHGLVDRVTTADRVDGVHRATLRLAPRLVRLRRRRTRRVFQELTSLEIATLVLVEWGLVLRPLAVRPLPRRPYSVQYDETDLAYLERLFAEDGLFYGFEHGEDATLGEVLVVADRPAELAAIPGVPRLVFDAAAQGDASRHADHVASEIGSRLRLRPERARVRGYDHRRPNLVLEDMTSPGGLETFDEDEGSYEDDLPPRPAVVRLEAVRRASEEVRATTFCRRLETLRRVVVDAEDERELVVTRLEHEAYGGERVPAGKARYQNRARLLPVGLVPRPKRAPEKPRQTSESAVVVGPPGAEIHTDPLGRVKVRFHWDRFALGDETSSCWLRVLTPWAGPGWGTSYTPRVGMEVLVTFVGGDVDRPICAGALPNAVMPPPFVGAMSGVRTRTTPEGTSGNEIQFDDTLGSERLLVIASRDLEEQVANARSLRVGGSRQAEIMGTDRTVVASTHELAVGEGRTAKVARDDELSVQGSRRVRVEGDAELGVHGSRTVLVEKDHVVEIRGRSSVVVGDPEASVHREDYVYGSLSFGAEGIAEIHSKTSIVIRCGESTLELLPDKIVLSAPTLELRAKDELAVVKKDGPAIRLTDEAEVLTKALRIFTDAGALELDQDFKVKGVKIQLGYDPSKPSHEAEGDAPETVPLELILSNADFEPYAGCDYHVLVGSQRLEGKTGGDGKLNIDVPKDTRTIVVKVWEKDYPTGPAKTFDVAIGASPPASDVAGMKTRLRNLGYYRGAIDEVDDAAFRAAVRSFQDDHEQSHDLRATGEPDVATQGALEDVHGS